MPPLPCKPIRERPRPLCSLRLIIGMDRRGQDPGGRKQACASAVANLTVSLPGLHTSTVCSELIGNMGLDCPPPAPPPQPTPTLLLPSKPPPTPMPLSSRRPNRPIEQNEPVHSDSGQPSKQRELSRVPNDHPRFATIPPPPRAIGDGKEEAWDSRGVVQGKGVA